MTSCRQASLLLLTGASLFTRQTHLTRHSRRFGANHVRMDLHTDLSFDLSECVRVSVCLQRVAGAS